MAASHFKWAACYIDGRKIARATEGSFELSESGEAVITEDGWAGESDGPIMSSMNVTQAVAVGGNGHAIEDAFIKRKFVKMTWGLLNGRIYTAEMKIKTLNFSGSHQNGNQTLAFTASGGQPEITSA
jgi:hypothetical protein